MKKWGVYLALVLAGLILGYLLFGSSETGKEFGEEMMMNAESGRWTCSMHPEVDGAEDGSCPLCAMDLVYVEENQGALSRDQFKMSEEALALANIQTTIVGTTNADGISLKLSGVITTNKETDAIQTTLFDGRVDALYPNYVGKKVRSGQEIGRVYSPELYLAQDKLLTSVSYKDTHKRLYAAARNTLGLWKMTDKQIDEMIAKGEPMVNFPLYADVSGTVTEVIAEEGNYYKQGAPLYKVSDLRSVWVVLDAYEEQLSLLKVGQDVELYLAAFPGERLTAKISFVEPVMHQDKRTLAVRVLLKNNDGKLKPGMFVEGQIKAKSSGNNILTVPKTAVLWTGKRSIVYKKISGNQPIFEMTEVELGRSFSENYEVVSGLFNGDEIVVEGAFTVDAAAQLMGKTSMMNKRKQDKHQMPNGESDIKDNPGLKSLTIKADNGISQLLDDYFELKDALVATDYNSAKKKVNKLKGSLQVVFSNVDNETSSWKVLGNEITSLESARNIESLRKGFKPFSNEFIGLVRKMDNLPNPIFVQFCPMADNNKGANWLSLEEKIQNPYFGEKMMSCGMVKDEIN